MKSERDRFYFILCLITYVHVVKIKIYNLNPFVHKVNVTNNDCFKIALLSIYLASILKPIS